MRNGVATLIPETWSLGETGIVRQKTLRDIWRDYDDSSQNAGRLRPRLDHRTARGVFWMFTGTDVYRMLVRERGWSYHKYQDWLADTLVHALLPSGRANPVRSRAVKRDSLPGHV